MGYLTMLAIRTLRRVLDVSVSGSYHWTLRPESNRSKKNRGMQEVIKTTQPCGYFFSNLNVSRKLVSNFPL